MHVRWDETAQATPHGQVEFFAEFLATAGVFDRWLAVAGAAWTRRGSPRRWACRCAMWRCMRWAWASSSA
ncbi:hypothetical protein [Achromobacter aegrifaciens]